MPCLLFSVSAVLAVASLGYSGAMQALLAGTHKFSGAGLNKTEAVMSGSSVKLRQESCKKSYT